MRRPDAIVKNLDRGAKHRKFASDLPEIRFSNSKAF
jgi:hypothetical protein